MLPLPKAVQSATGWSGAWGSMGPLCRWCWPSACSAWPVIHQVLPAQQSKAVWQAGWTSVPASEWASLGGSLAIAAASSYHSSVNKNFNRFFFFFFFLEIDSLIIKHMWKSKKPRIVETLWKWRENVGGFILCNLKIYCKIT